MFDEIDLFDEDTKKEHINISFEEKQRIKDFVNNYHQRIFEKLSNPELRKKISYTMQSLFTSVIFDCINKTIQGIKKNGEPLPIIKIYDKNGKFKKSSKTKI